MYLGEQAKVFLDLMVADIAIFEYPELIVVPVEKS
jgi:hypothetical protein